MYNKLNKEFPELFEKAGPFELSVDDGWYNIIRVLMTLMSRDVRAAKRSNKGLEEAINNLPVIEQVKEKFGDLRFYASNCSEKNNNYIVFAETMSSITCEVCGSPGELRTGGWLKTLCDTHTTK